MNVKEAHAAQSRNFKRILAGAAESVKWFSSGLGGDGRLEQAMDLWYKEHPNLDVRGSLELEDDICPDPDCLQCYGENWFD